MSNESRQLEDYIKTQEEAIKKHEALTRLTQNADFQLIFDEMYFDDYAKGLVFNLASVKENKEQHQDYVEELEAIGRVRAFLSSIGQTGNVARAQIQAAEEQLEELRVEGED